jgi:hypothetical protein
LLDIATLNSSNNLIEEGLVLDSKLKDVKLFNALCLITCATTARDTGTALGSVVTLNAAVTVRPPRHNTGACPVKGQKAKRRC